MATLINEDRRAYAEVSLHFRIRIGEIEVMLTEEQARDVIRRLNLAFGLSEAAIVRLEDAERNISSAMEIAEEDARNLWKEMDERYAAMGEYAEWAKARIAALEERLGIVEEPESPAPESPPPCEETAFEVFDPPPPGTPYSEDEIERIRALLEQGRRPKFIGAVIGRSEASVYQKINGTPDLFALYRPDKAAKEKELRDMLEPQTDREEPA